MTPDEEVRKVAERLTPGIRRNLFALPSRAGVWLTISEMRGWGASGSGMDLLHCRFLRTPLCDRRWETWGSDRIHGQTRGEGYEYSITPFGLAVRKYLLTKDNSHGK